MLYPSYICISLYSFSYHRTSVIDLRLEEVEDRRKRCFDGEEKSKKPGPDGARNGGNSLS